MLGEQREIKNVVSALARTLALGCDSPCFCGNGKKFTECCGSEEPDKLVFIEKGFDSIKAYATAFDWTISTIPGRIWKLFESAALERLPCLFPQCGGKPVSCHLIPENILRSTYGGHCKELKLKDGSKTADFVRTGINRAGCLPVFCSEHDNAMFRNIDELRIDFSSKEQHSVLAVKAIAFSLRKTQYILGIDSQVEIARPFLNNANPRTPERGHFELNIDHFAEQYVRFKAINALWCKAMAVYFSKSWDSLVYFHRVIQCSESLFVAGVVNPPHDLKGKRINRSADAIAITCTLYANDGELHVILACLDEESKHLYREFLVQVEAATDEVFVTVLNNLLTSFPMNAFLLPEAFETTQRDLGKMQSGAKRASDALKVGGPCLYLKRPRQAVEFIRSTSPRGVRGRKVDS